MTVHVLHENDAWFGPFADALDAAELSWTAWHLDGGALDLDLPPPEGVFWSRMSASAGTRGHDRAIAHTRTVLDWLEAHGRRVVNGRSALELEVSKAAQHVKLRAAGIDTPRSATVVGREPEDVARVASALPAPLVVKPNRGGTGAGVTTFADQDALRAAALDDALPRSPDDVLIVQEYIVAPAPRITRVELVGGRLLYGVDVDTSEGFELCPADACRVDGSSPFRLREHVEATLVARYEAFAAANHLEVVAFEHVETADGRLLTYDVNTNTNYNPDVERVAPRSGPRAVAGLLRDALAATSATPPAGVALD